jgi:hypothetical protein
MKRQDMKYSQLCRFFYKALSGEAKSCNKGDGCHFAHTPKALSEKSRTVSTGNKDRRAGERDGNRDNNSNVSSCSHTTSKVVVE